MVVGEARVVLVAVRIRHSVSQERAGRLEHKLQDLYLGEFKHHPEEFLFMLSQSDIVDSWVKTKLRLGASDSEIPHSIVKSRVLLILP